MNRRKLLTFIGLAPFVPVAAKAAASRSAEAEAVIADFDWAIMKSVPMQFTAIAGGGPGGGLIWYDRLVCENHHDKAWPDECDCGPGMHYADTLRS